MLLQRTLCLTALLLTYGAAAAAAQVVVLDSHWVHTADLADSHYRQPPISGSPANWVAPVDYASGSAWVHLEVLTKPTDEPTKFQVCFEGTPSYGCTNQSMAYTTTGTLEWETPFANFYIPPNESVDWTKGTKSIAAILKDTMNGKPSAGNVGAERAARFTPTEVRVVVTLVTKGGTYIKPPPFQPPDAGSGDAGRDSGTSGDASGTDTGTSTGTSTGGSVTGSTGTGGATTGSGGANGNGGNGAGGATTAAGGSTPASSGGSMSPSGGRGATASSNDDSGCSVARSPSRRGTGGSVVLLFATIALLRRKAQSTRRGSMSTCGLRPAEPFERYETASPRPSMVR